MVRDVKRKGKAASEREGVLMLLEFTDISEMKVLEGEACCCFQL